MKPSRVIALQSLVAAALIGAASAAPAERQSADRLGPVLERKVELERELTRRANDLLGRVAGADQAYAIVSLSMSARQVTEGAAGKNAAMSFTMGKVSSEQSLKLPGLPSVESGMGKIAQPVKMRVESRDASKQAATTLLTSVDRIVVRLFVDPLLAAPRLQLVREALAELVQLDEKRGDKLVVTPLAGRAPEKPAPARPPWLTALYVGLVGLPASLLLATALIAAAIRRRRGGSGDGASVKLQMGAGEGGPTSDEDESGTSDGSDGAGADTSGANGHRVSRFLELGEASAEELALVLTGLDNGAAVVVLALAPLTPLAAAGALALLPQQRQVALATRLGEGLEVERTALEALGPRVVELLAEARNPTRIKVGGAARLAALLSASNRATVRHVLRELESSAPEIARAARAQVKQFEDLPTLSLDVRRQLVATIDPLVLAQALHGADDAVGEAIRAVLSRRLARILEEERRTIKTLDAETVETARERVQQMLRGLGARAAS